MKTENSNIKLLIAFAVVGFIAFRLYHFSSNGEENASQVSAEAKETKETKENNPGYNIEGIDAGFEGIEDYNKQPGSRKKAARSNSKRAMNGKKNSLTRAKWKIHKSLIKKAMGTPLILPNNDWKERVVDSRYTGVTAVKTIHKTKEVVVETIITETPMDEDDLEYAANAILKTDFRDLNPVKEFKLENKYLENISVFETDDDKNPVYVVRANVKGRSKEVFVSVSGDGADIKSELEDIKAGFRKMVFFEAVDKNKQKIR